jgi:hypothetical protein
MIGQYYRRHFSARPQCQPNKSNIVYFVCLYIKYMYIIYGYPIFLGNKNCNGTKKLSDIPVPGHNTFWKVMNS